MFDNNFLYVGQGDVGIASLKFEYENETSEMIVVKEHGKKTLLGYQEFEVDYPSEYVTSIEGCYDNVVGAGSGVITMLRFKTNKRTSPPFGLESASSFAVQKEGYKIVGFHGKSSALINQIGAGTGWLLAVKRSKGRPCIWPDKWEDSREPHSSQSGASLHLDQIQISQSYSSKNTPNERQRPAPLSI
ncbi:hypothetical protein DY000_02048600 [Brassica cretica]|uniref:Jacalin-type lectin domain-containing protein n=1 Tax=Brassica cretica TaxID=69181 RepID=A0ABQ7EU84_BRACR|nr:hypothetical protein DY000_02048600 [Brassica cretica]